MERHSAQGRRVKDSRIKSYSARAVLAGAFFLCGIVFAWQAIMSPHRVYAQPAYQQDASQQTAPPPAEKAEDAQQSQPSPQPQGTPQSVPVVRSETRVVRVDVIVTDKKGNYIHDLTANDFRVYDDNKQQQVNNFSFGADPNSPAASERRYMVLFFDDSSMDTSDQPRARAAAAKFIDANVGPDRAIAIVEYGGTLRITQNFTTDAERLKQAVSGVKISAVTSNAPPATGAAAGPADPTLSGAERNFGAYSVLLSIRSLAKNLASVAGRKSLVLFTAGFPLTPERDSELLATIDACNKANVAIYPLDVRGLQARLTPSSKDQNTGRALAARVPHSSSPRSVAGFQLASFHPTADLDPEPQHGGGGGGGGAGVEGVVVVAAEAGAAAPEVELAEERAAALEAEEEEAELEVGLEEEQAAREEKAAPVGQVEPEDEVAQGESHAAALGSLTQTRISHSLA